MTGERSQILGLAIIARDEETSLPLLLETVSGCFDQVALLDTGSTDHTVAVFEAWAAHESETWPAFQATIGRADWSDDFAAARNAADAMLETEWRAWADADDQIRGAVHLRDVVAQAPDELAGFIAGYQTSDTPAGGRLAHTKRIRVTRRAMAHWQCPVHEELIVRGNLAEIPEDVALWVHRADATNVTSRQRNLRILHSWLEREADNPRALAHAGREQALGEDHEQAIEYFRRFIARSRGWDEEQAQIHRQLGLSLIALGRLDEAAADAVGVTVAMPDWPDSYLTLAEVAFARGDFDAAVSYSRKVLELGPPKSPILQLTTDYTARPHLLIAAALARMGNTEQSRRFAAEALAGIGEDA